MTGVGRGVWGLGIWGLVAAGVLSVAWAAMAPIGGPLEANPIRPRPSPLAPVRRYEADSLARVTVARPLFRAGRRPAGVAYDPAPGAQSVVPEARPPKPVLVLVGVVAGSEPTAVIEGFPGVEGARVVRKGDVITGLTVTRIAGQEVRIVGMDTVWTLTVREPWK